MLLRRALVAANFAVDEIVEAGDADEARAAQRLHPADLVLLDLNIPAGDGVDLVAEFKQQSAAHVVIVSAESSDVRLAQARANGADGYLRKPFFPEALRRELAPLLD
jgi:DNA-binding response OmpR family regulator